MTEPELENLMDLALKAQAETRDMEHYIEYLEYVVDRFFCYLGPADGEISRLVDEDWLNKNPNSPHGRDL